MLSFISHTLYLTNLFENPLTLYNFTNLIIFRHKRWARFSSRNFFRYFKLISTLKFTSRDIKKNSYSLFTHSLIRFNYCFGFFSPNFFYLLYNSFWLFFYFNSLKLHFIFSRTRIANSILFLNISFSKKLTSLFNPSLSTNFITKFKVFNDNFAFLYCFCVYSIFLPNVHFLYNMRFLYDFYKLSGGLRSFNLVSYNSTNKIIQITPRCIFYLILTILNSIYKFFIYLNFKLCSFLYCAAS